MALKRRYKGFDYGGHPDESPRAPAEELAATAAKFDALPDFAPTAPPDDVAEGDQGEWVHKGGGYYEHTVTGDVQRGKPE